MLGTKPKYVPQESRIKIEETETEGQKSKTKERSSYCMVKSKALEEKEKILYQWQHLTQT